MPRRCAMGLPEYVFCRWNNRLWPARVLSRQKQSSNKWSLSVEIFIVMKQINVSLTNTKPFLIEELQKISDVLERTKKRIPSTEVRNYQKALKVAAEKIQSSTPSASPSTDMPNEKAYEQKEATIENKGSKYYNTRQNKATEKAKGNFEGNEKLKDSDAAVSSDSLEIPTTCDTGISPTKCSTAQNIERNRKKPLNKRPDELPCGEAVYDDVSHTDDQKSKKNVPSVAKLKGCVSNVRDLDSLTVSLQERGQNRTNPRRPVQCRMRLSSKSGQESNTNLHAESSETDTENGNGHRVNKYVKNRMPDFEEEKGLLSSELSMEISSPECTALCAESSAHDDTEEDVQLPVVMLQKEPAAIVRGSFVWCKFKQYPYWPSLVKLVDSKHRKASIIFLESSISDPTKKKISFKVALRSIKPYDCPQKQQLLENARKDFGKSIDWCDSLISDYRIRLGCGSFSGSFVDYCTADISLPVRRELEDGKREVFFPILDSEVTEDQEEEINIKLQTNRKLLPDRARAARDRANEKLVEFIVYGKEAENHLLDILAGKRESQWLTKYKSSNRRMNCLETYIEDEEQIELVVDYLQTVCDKMSSETKKLMLGDQAQFIFEVLIPEAVIFAISATEQIGYEKAEMKYLKGPSVSKRERKIFEEQILEKKRFKLSEESKIKDSRK